MNNPQIDSDDGNGLLKITSSHLLLVEGKDEVNFFKALLREIDNSMDIQIMDIGGKENIHTNLRMLSVSPQFDEVISIGIIRDADNDPFGAFQSACTAIENAGLSKPAKPKKLAGQNPSVTVMILPDEDSEGMLEDVCISSVKNNPEYSCINDFFKCLKEKGITVPDQKSKSEVLAFLASNPEKASKFRIGLLGVAAQKGYFPLDNDVFAPVKDFLKSLVI